MKNEIVQDVLIVFGMFVGVVLLWNTVFIYPIKLFVVALHELSHGLAAILMGGGIEEIQISYQVGGYCRFSLPGDSGVFSKAFVAGAGYLGSMLWGALIFLIATRTRWDRVLTFIIAVMMSILSYFVIRTGELFGIIFCFAFAIILFAGVKWLPDKFHDLFLKFLGLTSCLYVIIDIKEDLIDRTNIGSDADAIAGMLGNPSLSVPIGISWIVLAVIILFITFRIAYKDRNKR